MKELNKFREFLSEGSQWKVTISKNGTKTQFLVFSDEGKAIKTAKYINDGGMGDEFKAVVNVNEDLSENALANDKGDGTFEVTPDIDILGKKFNFSDICPGAHKLISDLADEYEGNDIKLGDLLYLANLHQTFFNIEKKALGPQGIDADELNEVKRLYVEIHNFATNAFGADVTKDVAAYMDMHMNKIKDAVSKASSPGGSSDRNFEEGYEPTDKELDFADEIEYEQDWRDEQDDLFGKPMGKLEEQLAEVRSRLEDAIEGYTDLHKNDVVLESFLEEEEIGENKKYVDDQLKFKKGDTVYFKNVKGGEKLPMTITGPGKFMKSNRLDAGGKEIVFPVKGGPGGKGMYAADDLVKEDQKKIEEGPVQTFTSGLDKYQSYPHVYVFKVRTMSTDKQGGKFVYNNTYEVKDGLDWNGVLAQVDQLIASPETIAVGVDIYYTTGQKEGQLGGQAEVVRWNHDAVYKAPKSDYILNARKNQFEDEEAERIMAIRNFMNSSSMGRPPQNVDDQAEKLYPAIKRIKDEVKNILATK